jgi:hypothetical protein
MGWAGHVARREKINACVLLENPRGSYSKKDLGIHGGVVLKKDRTTI